MLLTEKSIIDKILTYRGLVLSLVLFSNKIASTD